MLERGKLDRGIVEIVDTESLVPKDHLLRKIDVAVDFNRLYEMVEPLYSEDNGRPSVDPVVLFKMVLIQHLYGLPSLRRTADEVSANICCRWFLGYTLQEETPHFSTVSHNFRHRFTEDTVNQIFSWILEEVAEAGYLSPKAVFIDGTHIKANANTKKQIKEQVPVASKHIINHSYGLGLFFVDNHFLTFAIISKNIARTIKHPVFHRCFLTCFYSDRGFATFILSQCCHYR